MIGNCDEPIGHKQWKLVAKKRIFEVWKTSIAILAGCMCPACYQMDFPVQRRLLRLDSITSTDVPFCCYFLCLFLVWARVFENLLHRSMVFTQAQASQLGLPSRLSMQLGEIFTPCGHCCTLGLSQNVTITCDMFSQFLDSPIFLDDHWKSIRIVECFWSFLSLWLCLLSTHLQ